MSERATLLALAERCETAEGPDDVLDADIMAAVHPELTVHPWVRRTYPNGKRPFFADTSDPDNLNVVSTSRFTASLDAAVTLVPDDYGWQMRRGHVGGGRTVCYLWDGKGIWSPTVVAATPALALCAAALRARAAEVGE